MKKYISLLKYEMKTILKDPMNVFMLTYPVVMLLVCAYLLPMIIAMTNGENSSGEAITLLIGFIVILAVGGFLMGAMLGFSLLDNKDEMTLINIAVSPITVSGYATFKIIYTYVLSIIANLIMLGGLKLLASDVYTIQYQQLQLPLLDSISYGEILVFSIVTSFFVPAIALVIASIAKNKIEGFALIKGGGLIVFIPVLALLDIFQDWKQYILGIVPIFWPLKAILNESFGSMFSSNLPFCLYMVIGSVYSIGLGLLALRGFLKKINIK
jgi:fluoroquinolone transport system permease protein